MTGAILLTLIGSGLPVPYHKHSDCNGDYAPGVVLVGLPPHPQPYSLGEKTGREEGIHVFATAETEILVLHVPVGQECAARQTLRQEPNITFAELDYAVHATETRFLGETGFLLPNDPAWSNQWGPAKIDAPDAWDVTTGDHDIMIAVLDTGVQAGHEDLSDNVWINHGEIPDNRLDDDGNGKVDDVRGWHFYHKWAWDGDEYTYLPKEDNRVGDDHGHGTHVAGIAGAAINNGIGIAGMAGNSRLMAVKVLDEYGNGWYSDLAQGIVYAVDNGADVINLSVGGELASETLQEAVNYAHDHGVLVVAAAGNDGGSVLYPAACEHALAVTATDQNDQQAGFSNHGPEVDVAAPGTEIYSTWYRGNYFTRSGTSMSTPHVSGLAALVWSARPDLATAQVTEIITSTARDVNGGTLQLPGWDEYLGWGRIDAGRALSATLEIDSIPTHWYYLPVVLRMP